MQDTVGAVFEGEQDLHEPHGVHANDGVHPH